MREIQRETQRNTVVALALGNNSPLDLNGVLLMTIDQ
jgi:hypothetical protein